MKIPLFALPHRVTIIPFEGEGAYGPAYGEPRKNRPANIEAKTRFIRSSDGQDYRQEAKGIFQAGEVIKTGDKVIWERYGKEYTVGSWQPIEAMGPHSVEVELV